MTNKPSKIFLPVFPLLPLMRLLAYHSYSLIFPHREAFIALAILRLIEQEKAVVEGAGAAGLAAIIQGLVPELKGKKFVLTRLLYE